MFKFPDNVCEWECPNKQNTKADHYRHILAGLSSLMLEAIQKRKTYRVKSNMYGPLSPFALICAINSCP
jgi:hypothetical protein